MSRVPGALWNRLLAVQIYSPNTNVGKTVFSTLLGAHFARRRDGTKWRVKYIKPISTGPASDADDSYVKRYTGQSVTTLFQFKEPVSPHIAALDGPHVPRNEEVVQSLFTKLQEDAQQYNIGHDEKGIAIVETAGGVLSPGPSGTLQADIYRPLRLPAVLVGDHKLGGIGATISAAESLIMRGYEIDAVVCFDDQSKYGNAAYLQDYFSKLKLPLHTVPWIPDLEGLSEEKESEKMRIYYQSHSRGDELDGIAGQIIDRHERRRAELSEMAQRTHKTIWHPFTQHKQVKQPEDILVFDSAYGDYFQVKHTTTSSENTKDESNPPLLYPAFDGSASWWTQGLGHGNPRLALEAAYAAGRYGHVMFAGATHEPALTLAEKMLTGLDNPRLKKVFYSDDGSTATEVGMKMGLRAACKRYGWEGSQELIGVLGLKGSYHGDTIGAMDASEPCVYNEKVDWYRGRGYWLDYPTFKMKDGRWIVEPPAGMTAEFGPPEEFENLEDIFDFKSRTRTAQYDSFIEKTLDRLTKEQGRKFGALIMEPVILGAGGMIFVDPLFQRSLVRVVRKYDFGSVAEQSTSANADDNAWTGLPVVFDEVFTGLYRLGRFSSSSFLDVHPDISVHAKLLTGGLLPLAVTTASQSIFDAFWGDEKSEALLHGHSYTAHAVGCHIANVSLETMQAAASSHTWQGLSARWLKPANQKQFAGTTSSNEEVQSTLGSKFWSMWSHEFVVQLSKHERIDCVNALGSVLSIALKDHSGSGYTSTAAVGLRDMLLNRMSDTDIQIHSRILGNVIYFMASITSEPRDLAAIEAAFMEKLEMLR